MRYFIYYSARLLAENFFSFIYNLQGSKRVHVPAQRIGFIMQWKKMVVKQN